MNLDTGAPPSYSGPLGLELAYPLTQKDGRVLATLRVQSRASLDSLPHIVQDDPIQGCFDLSLYTETKIKSISVEIIGDLASNAETRPRFLHESMSLFPARVEELETRGEKLKGSYSWPFTLQLPQHVSLSNHDGDINAYPLPSTVLGSQTMVNITYTLRVNIKFGSFFHPDRHISTQVVYTTKTRPESHPALRLLAYEEGMPAFGPNEDPLGWRWIPLLTIRGTNHRGRELEAMYKLALAKPLSYTRGSIIPLHVVVTCADTQLLNILSDPEALSVALQRTSMLGYDIRVYHGRPSTPTNDHPSLDTIPVFPSRCYRFDRIHVQKAAWSPRTSDHNSKSTSRALDGEIHLARRLDPTTRLGRYSHTYQVVLSPPNVQGFSLSKEPMSKAYSVEICTLPATGPRPVARLPPAYDEIRFLDKRS